MEKILFLDRDGTLVREPADYQIDRLAKIRLVDGVIPALLSLRQAGYRLVMISNQDGLGSERFPSDNFEQCHQFILHLFQSQGIDFDAILICPHDEKDDCDCRKPKLGLVMDYITQRRFDPNHSYVIGDRRSDMLLADKMAITGFMVGEEMTWPIIANTILTKPRKALIARSTQETDIQLSVNLDDETPGSIESPCHFLNHMLAQVSKHGGFRLDIIAEGDMAVDDHHLVEDIAICLGQAINKALSDRRGIERYGFTLPMDESLSTAVIDLSGRAGCVFTGKFSREKVGDLATEMVPHFFTALSQHMAATVHISVEGDNTHHMVEACFKVFGRAFKQAIVENGYKIASTKGCF